MDASAPVRRPWPLVAATLVLACMVAYVLFGAYIPAQQRMARLEKEIREVYKREADLHLQLAQSGQRMTALQKQVAALRAERDSLAERLRRTEAELTALNKRRR